MSLYNDASLVMIPSAYKDGKLYSIKPTDGSGDFTFSRGSNLAATRVDENGLIEKGRENLLLQSNQFDTSWSPNSGTFTQGVSDPNGGTDAWIWEAVNTSPYLYQTLTPYSGISCLSIWVKGVGSTIGKNFQIRGGSGVPLKTIILTSDWQRVEHYGDYSSNPFIGFEFGIPAVIGDVVHIYAAQYEQGLVATDYIETTTTTTQVGILEDMPRLDYSGSCPSLLLEPQRTNAMPHSEYFADLTPAASVLVANSATSPEGLQNAYLIYPSSSTSNVGAYKSSIAAGTTGVVSCFVKSAGKRYAMLGTDNTANYICVFDLQEGEVVVEPTDYTGTIESYGNGWYRITAAYVNGTALNYPFIGLSDDTSRNVVVDGTNGIYIYGMQYEINASYPTSYIPCYGAATTRSKDHCLSSSLTASTDFTIFFEAPDFCLINGSIGGVFANIQFVFSSNGSAYPVDGSYHIYNNSLYYWNGSTNTSFGVIYNNQTDSKFALVKRGDSMIVFANGSKVNEVALPSGSDSRSIYWDTISLTEGTLTDAQGDVFNPYYKQVAKFDTALTDSEAIALTTI